MEREITAADLLNLSAWGTVFKIEGPNGFRHRPGVCSVELLGVPILKAPSLAAELTRLGFDVPDALVPSPGGVWALDATAKVGMWDVEIHALIREAHAPVKRDPKPLNAIKEDGNE